MRFPMGKLMILSKILFFPIPSCIQMWNIGGLTCGFYKSLRKVLITTKEMPYPASLTKLPRAQLNLIYLENHTRFGVVVIDIGLNANIKRKSAHFVKKFISTGIFKVKFLAIFSHNKLSNANYGLRWNFTVTKQSRCGQFLGIYKIL